MELSLAFSPCPNDTYAFHAMINGLVDTEGLKFRCELADVEQLNNRAFKGAYDICKLSYHAYFYILDKYIMLRSGSALGYGNGPLFVMKANKKIETTTPLIAIPGEYTTASLLLKIAYPQYKNTKAMIFSSIEKAILDEEVDAGILIHEGRFTYQSKGLQLIRDLGEYWQYSFDLPLPLGGIAVKREHPIELQQKIGRVLRRSITFANINPNISKEFIHSNAQELSPLIQQKHIELFVNNNTIDIDKKGVEAVKFMYKKFIL